MFDNHDWIVLRETIWVHEACINDPDLSRGYGQTHKRDLYLQ